MPFRVDAHSPIPIRRQPTEQLKHVIEAGGVSRDRPLPSIRELASFLGVNPIPVARVIEDLKQSGYVEARRGRGDEFAVGVLTLTEDRPAAVREDLEILLVESSPSELELFARELEAQLPVRVEKVRLVDLAVSARRKKPPGRWAAAVTSFAHLPDVERRLGGLGIPVIALLAEVHLETLHRLAQLPPGTRVGVASAEPETAHNGGTLDRQRWAAECRVRGIVPHRAGGPASEGG